VQTEIKIIKESGTGAGWSFSVCVKEGEESREYEVTLNKDYWQTLTKGEVEPRELVYKSFQFLLAREPKESILSRFDLDIIKTYFPEYEREMESAI